MPDKIITRGDSYGSDRAVYRYLLANRGGGPFDLRGSTVRATFKTDITTPVADPNDDTATIKATLTIDGAGVETLANKLHLVGSALDGTVELRLTAAETLALPLGSKMISDFEVTDAAGQVKTFYFEDALTTRDGLTNRTTG